MLLYGYIKHVASHTDTLTVCRAATGCSWYNNVPLNPPPKMSMASITCELLGYMAKGTKAADGIKLLIN